MARDRGQEPRNEGGSVALRQSGLESPADFSRLAFLVRATQEGDPAAVAALVTALTPTVLHVLRALLGTRRHDIEARTREALLEILEALPSWRGECTLLHFATRIAVRRAVASEPEPRSWIERLRLRRLPPPFSWRDDLSNRRLAFLRTFFGELPDAEGEAMILRLALGYSLQEIALVTTTAIPSVRSRLRLAKEALRVRIEADPEWEMLWGEEA
jgi:DNA-directed RNA polymerase specialized sigma24 family protein